jgi:hypothetical protein
MTPGDEKGAEPAESQREHDIRMAVAALANLAYQHGREMLHPWPLGWQIYEERIVDLAASAPPRGPDSAREAQDAMCFRFLQDLPVVAAQAYFWNYGSRRERRKAILDSARAALASLKGTEP